MICVRDISVGYGPKILCSGVSFDLAPGETVVLTGANGSGKTTLLRQLATMEDLPQTVLVPTGIPKVKGFTLREFLRTACYALSNWRGRLDAAGEKAIGDALDLLEIRDLEDHDISTLSDGEFQKGCIAVALVRQASLLLLDEPTAFLDVENRLLVLRTLHDVARRTGISVLFSSHDIPDALTVADRVFAITADGRFVASDTTAASKENAVRAAFPRSF